MELMDVFLTLIILNNTIIVNISSLLIIEKKYISVSPSKKSKTIKIKVQIDDNNTNIEESLTS